MDSDGTDNHNNKNNIDDGIEVALHWKTLRETLLLPDIQADFPFSFLKTIEIENDDTSQSTQDSKFWYSFSDGVHAPIGYQDTENTENKDPLRFSELYPEDSVFNSYPENNPSFNGHIITNKYDKKIIRENAIKNSGGTIQVSDQLNLKIDSKDLTKLLDPTELNQSSFGKNRPFIEIEQQTILTNRYPNKNDDNDDSIIDDVNKKVSVASLDSCSSTSELASNYVSQTENLYEEENQFNTQAKTIAMNRSITFKTRYTDISASPVDLKSFRLFLEYNTGEIDSFKDLESNKNDKNYVSDYIRDDDDIIKISKGHKFRERFMFHSPTSVYENNKLNFAINSIDVSHVGDIIVIGGEDSKLVLLETETGKIVRHYNDHVGDVNRVQFFPSNKVFLSGGADTKINIWGIENGNKPAATLIGHKGGIIDTCIIDRGRNFLSSANDSKMILWECSSAKNVWEYELKSNEYHLGKPGVINEITMGNLNRFYSLLKETSSSLIENNENLYSNYYEPMFIKDFKDENNPLEHGTSNKITFLATSEQSWIGIDLRIKRPVLRDPLFSMSGYNVVGNDIFSLKNRQYNDRRNLTSIAYTDGYHNPMGKFHTSLSLPYGAPLLATGSKEGIVTIFDLRNTSRELYTVYNYTESRDSSTATFMYNDSFYSKTSSSKIKNNIPEKTVSSKNNLVKVNLKNDCCVFTTNSSVEIEMPRRKPLAKVSFVDDLKRYPTADDITKIIRNTSPNPSNIVENNNCNNNEKINDDLLKNFKECKIKSELKPNKLKIINKPLHFDILVTQNDGQTAVLPLDLSRIFNSSKSTILAPSYGNNEENKYLNTHNNQQCLPCQSLDEPQSILTHREEIIECSKQKEQSLNENYKAEEDEEDITYKPFTRILIGGNSLGGISNTNGNNYGQSVGFVDSRRGSHHSKQLVIATRSDEFGKGSTIRVWKWV